MSDPCRTCCHIKTDGSLCLSPALRASAYCYFHTRDHQRCRNLGQASDVRAHQPQTDALESEVMRSLAIPDLEDAHAVQVALSAVIRALALGHLTTFRASLLLRGLRSAIVNLRNLPPFGQTDDIATEDPQPIGPLLSVCAPDPWVLPPDADADPCPPESREGSAVTDKPESTDQEPSSACHLERASREGPLPSPESLQEPQTEDAPAREEPFLVDVDLNVN